MNQASLGCGLADNIQATVQPVGAIILDITDTSGAYRASQSAARCVTHKVSHHSRVGFGERREAIGPILVLVVTFGWRCTSP